VEELELNSYDSIQGLVKGCCENGDGTSGCIKD
jgi:hypothetical protein